jgi:hypothetical protein
MNMIRIEVNLFSACKATLVRGSNKVKKVVDKFKAKCQSEWSESYYTKRDAYVEVPV